MAKSLRGELSALSPFVLFALAGVLGTIAIAGASLIASQRAGESEAISEVRGLTQVVAKTVVEPNLSTALLDGDETSLDELDRLITTRVIDETTVRVKLWDENGRIVYSDEPRLIGEAYELGDDKTMSLRTGELVSEVSSLEGPENRFEAGESQLLEVYLPIAGPNGEPLLYESYFSMSEVTDSAGRIRSEFAPIILAALGLMAVMHLGLAWGLSRRLRRSQREREALLQHAIDSSHLERRRIAEDLHDGVVHDLIGATFAVRAAADLADREGADVADELRTAAHATRRSLQSLRSMLVDIYPPNLQEQGLEAALADLLAPASSLGIDTELTVPDGPDGDSEAAMLSYRVVQEAVRNVLRHAEATSISVRVAACPEAIEVTVTDDGKGFAPGDQPAGRPLGLQLLADLAGSAGATFSVSSHPGQGTTVGLAIPTARSARTPISSFPHV